MNPEKIKMIGYVSLGVWVLLAGGLGYMAYDASSARAEAEETLQSENDAFNRFNNAPVFPSAASISSVKSNEMAWSIYGTTPRFRLLDVETRICLRRHLLCSSSDFRPPSAVFSP